jgi:hypothetical protein
VPPPRTPAPPPDQPVELVLDPYTFTAPERMECQVQFDTAFGDLLTYTRQSWDPAREGPMTSAVVARDGTRYFPDQIIAFMLWVQEKRTRPDVQLAEFDGLTLAELNSAHVRGLLGKAQGSNRPRRKKPGPGPVSSASTED